MNYQSDKIRRASCSWVALSITALPLHPKQGQWMTSPTAEAVSSVAQQHRGAGDQHIHFRQVGAYAKGLQRFISCCPYLFGLSHRAHNVYGSSPKHRTSFGSSARWRRWRRNPVVCPEGCKQQHVSANQPRSDDDCGKNFQRFARFVLHGSSMQSVELNLMWLSVFQQHSDSLISFLASYRFGCPAPR